MYFDSWQAVWQMGGHGPFVWAAYTIAAVTLAATLWAPLSRHRRLLAQQASAARRQQGRRSR